MKLLPGEKQLVEGGNGVLTLTTHRIRFDAKGSGNARLVSMTLDSVASCGLVSRSNPLLILAALFVGGSGILFARQLGSTSVYALGFAIILGIAYFLSRASVLSIASGGESIQASVKGMNHAAVVDFIDSVEEAKLAFLSGR